MPGITGVQKYRQIVRLSIDGNALLHYIKWTLIRKGKEVILINFAITILVIIGLGVLQGIGEISTDTQVISTILALIWQQFLGIDMGRK